MWKVIGYQYRLGIMNNKNVFRSGTFFFQKHGDSQDYSFPPENLFTLISIFLRKIFDNLYWANCSIGIGELKSWMWNVIFFNEF